MSELEEQQLPGLPRQVSAICARLTQTSRHPSATRRAVNTSTSTSTSLSCLHRLCGTARFALCIHNVIHSTDPQIHRFQNFYKFHASQPHGVVHTLRADGGIAPLKLPRQQCLNTEDHYFSFFFFFISYFFRTVCDVSLILRRLAHRSAPLIR